MEKDECGDVEVMEGPVVPKDLFAGAGAGAGVIKSTPTPMTRAKPDRHGTCRVSTATCTSMEMRHFIDSYLSTPQHSASKDII